eukprot:GEMP01019851.1.p1 GENE.GEMP01019851.1~~GEMP01019851.1.p1  ORF type:complete len:477 (+),score=98.03 GEMP01019851.1:59-1489(+)
MKFGKNIVAQQQRHPNFRYIDYKALKKIIKENDSRQTLCDVFERSLAQQISEVNKFFESETARILSDTAVEELSGQVVPPCIVTAIQDIDCLRKYAVWNAVAVVKILKKRRKKFAHLKETGRCHELYDSCADFGHERLTWLEREVFYNGQDFATLQAAVESLAQQFIGVPPSGSGHKDKCPICLEPRIDTIELACGHTFCWKCFVLGPICHANQEYRLTKCPICREDSEGTAVKAETMLSRFLSTYFPGMGKEQLEGYGGNDVSKDLMRMVMVMQEGKDGESSFFNVVHNQPSTPADLLDEQKRAQQLSWIALASNPIAFSYQTTFCMLCCEPLDIEAISILPCKHPFHDICLLRSLPESCPLCDVPVPETFYHRDSRNASMNSSRHASKNSLEKPYANGWPSDGDCSRPSSNSRPSNEDLPWQPACSSIDKRTPCSSPRLNNGLMLELNMEDDFDLEFDALVYGPCGAMPLLPVA